MLIKVINKRTGMIDHYWTSKYNRGLLNDIPVQIPKHCTLTIRSSNKSLVKI